MSFGVKSLAPLSNNISGFHGVTTRQPAISAGYNCDAQTGTTQLEAIQHGAKC